MARRLLLAYVSLIAVVLLVLEVPLGITYRDRQLEVLRAGVQGDAVVMASFAEDGLEGGTGASDRLREVATDYTRRTGGRVVVVDDTGAAVLDSDPLPEDVELRSFATRPEIEAALAGRVAAGTRFSSTLDTRLLYVAVPVASSGIVHGAVRVTFPTSAVDARVRRYWLRLTGIGAATLAVATIAGLVLARWVVRPIRELEQAAAALGAGSLATRTRSDAGPPEVRRLTASVNEMAARLEDLVGAQEAFVADASHQLRTPLTSLRLRLELLEGKLEATAPAEQQLDDVRAALLEVARLTRLVDGLLALAHVERTGSSATAAPVDLASAIEERADAWRPVADEEGVVLAVDAPPVRARATADRLAQILDNLIANAVEAAPEGSEVTLACADGPHGPEVHVLDRGPGLADEERARAFDRLWSGRAGSSRLGGSGLGLAIVRKLVDADGGTVELRPRPGGGLDATVTLPRP